MTLPEQRVVNASTKVLRDHCGPGGERVVQFNIGAGNGETGLPDRHALYRGRAIYLEFKRADGGVLAGKQAWWLERLRVAGGECAVVTDASQVRMMLCRIDREIAANGGDCVVGCSVAQNAQKTAPRRGQRPGPGTQETES